MPGDPINWPIDPAKNGITNIIPNPIADYMSLKNRVDSAFGKKGFEIHADYETETGDIILENTIIDVGTVLIGNRIYSTEPYIFSGENATIYLYAMKEKPIGSNKKGEWSVWVDNSEYEPSPKEGNEVIDSRWFKLLEIENGRVVTDNRYLLSFSRMTKVIPGTTYVPYEPVPGDGVCYVPQGETSCPDLYEILSEGKRILEGLHADADAYLEQM